ncbi:MAG: hypothetical protein WDN08_04460 [Rhizomicrobium sp.]
MTHSILGGVSAGRNGTVKGSRVLVRDVVAGKPSTSGGGLQAGTGGVIELDGSAVTRCSSIGVVSYHGAESVVTLRRSTVHGAGVAGNEYGHGIMVMSGAQVALHGTAVFDNAVIGLAASGGRATRRRLRHRQQRHRPPGARRIVRGRVRRRPGARRGRGPRHARQPVPGEQREGRRVGVAAAGATTALIPIDVPRR